MNISTYTNLATKLEWQCQKGHVWKAKPGHIKNSKSWCPECNKEKRKKPNNLLIK